MEQNYVTVTLCISRGAPCSRIRRNYFTSSCVSKNAFLRFFRPTRQKVARYKSSVLCPQTLENSSQLRFDFTLNFLILRAILAAVKQLFMALNSL